VSRTRAKLVNQRLRLLLLAIFVTFGALAARTAYLQTVKASSLARAATAQTRTTVPIQALRGTIFDRMGVPLAIGVQTTDVIADPMQITDPRREAAVVAKTLGIPEKKVLRQLSDRSVGFVYVERSAPAAKAAALAAKKLTGFTFQPDQQRVYPQGTVAAPVLGYVGTDHTGLAGLEAQFNAALSGRPGEATIVRDATGQLVETQQSQPVRNGKDVFLTLDSHIQANAERILEQTVAQYNAKDATAIVMDPRTGAILAMAQEPGFNANSYPQAVASGATVEHAINDVYEPGSVFKVVTIGGALAEHKITPQQRFKIPDQLRVSDHVIHDAEVHPTEWMSVSQILQRSSNVGTVTIAERYLGESGLKYWMRRFGFGAPTGIGFPGESSGLFPSYWSGTTIGNVPIGQGVSVTALQLASTYSAIANGGVWLRPHLVDHVAGSTSRPARHRRILTPAVDRQLRTMLKGVVSDQGTGALAAIPGYTVAGKTGTAQKPGPYGYNTGKYVATFVGMVPSAAPRLVVLVSVDEPQGAIYGGIVAAPAFEQIASFDLQYLGVPPDLPIH
jgi:cell division protein FtsI (penicillin-binding protein 3)/stage V sporulation protein D (sporulation-specific penicillin-binding protein)